MARDINDHQRDRLERVRALDCAALTAVYDEYQPLIYRYVYRQVGDVETARDLTADVFQRLLQALVRQTGPDNQLGAWLYRTAHNLVIDHYRRSQHRRHLPLDEAVPDSSADLDTLADKRLLAMHVRAVLQRLSPDQQQVIALKFLQGLSNDQAAEVLGKPVGAVKSLQHRALVALQRLLTSGKESVT
jgi:RNA polymerase sigma-70 factor, ECF subfamily